MHLPLAGRKTIRTDSSSIDAVSIKEGALFAVLSTDAVTLWHASSLTQLHCTRRVTASLESTGFNRRIFLRSDDQMIVVQTAGNVLLIYDLCEDSDPEARSLRTSDGNGIPRMWLKHRQNIRVEAGVLALSATPDRLIISTKRPAMIQTLFWHKQEGDRQTISKALKALTFLKKAGTSTRVVEILSSANEAFYLWLTANGAVYLVQNNGEEWQGNAVYEPQQQGTEAVLAVLNNSRASMTVSLANSELLTWVIEREGNMLFTRLLTQTDCSQSIGSIRSLTCTSSGDSMMACGETGWTLLTANGNVIDTTVFSSSSSVSPDADATTDTPSSLLRCSIWICDAYSAIFFPLESDSFVIEQFCVQIGLHLRTPRRVYSYHAARETTADQEYNSPWTATLPSSEVEYLSPLKYHVGSPCGRFLAIGGRSGIAHYSHASGLWKTHRSLADALETVLVAEPVWYHHYLIVATRLDASQYQISILSREFDVSDVLSYIVLDARPLLLAVQNGQLYFIQDNSTLHKCQIMRNKDGQIVMSSAVAFQLPPEVPRHGVRFRSLALLHEPADVRHAHLIIVQGDVLSLLYFPGSPKEHITSMKMAQQVEWAQVTEGTGRLRNAVLASTGRTLKLWFNVLNHAGMTDDVPTCSVEIAVDFIPLQISLEMGLIEGIAVKKNISHHKQVAAQSIRNLSYDAKSFVPDILRALIKQNMIGEAFVISTRYATSASFNYTLEVLLFKALEEAIDASNDTLLATWTLLQKHDDLMPEVVVACARKSEVTTWNTLFAVTGPPLAFYQAALAKGDLKTAGAYLVILLTMDTSLNHKDYTLDLISRAIKQAHWDLAIELTRFYSVVKGDKQEVHREIISLMPMQSHNQLRVITGFVS